MYLALYRKYRPKTFEDVISQGHIITTLKNEIVEEKTAHAYLFTGPRGTGKTTCSKILAMAVNCEHPNNGNPCLCCDSCKGIEAGSILDVVEIDAASNNGVDNIRQLREEASYTPSQCKYRVYIIDETHMLSTGAFNALLKIMEEPPEHVKFILATTEAHKVPATILSRCQRFDFRRIRSEDIEERLLKIAGSEEFTLTEDAAALIARLSDGGMRDAISLLDQCAAFEKDITLETVIQTAGVVGRDYLFHLTDAIAQRDASKAIQLIHQLYSMSKDMQGLLEEMIYQFRNIMLLKTLKNSGDLVSVLPDELIRLKEYAKVLDLELVLKTIKEMQECLDKMGKSYDKRLTLELCFVKLCAIPSKDEISELYRRLELLEKQINTAGKPAVLQQRQSLPEIPPAVPIPTDIQTEVSASIIPEKKLQSPPRAAESSAEAKPSSAFAEIRSLAEWDEVLSLLSQTDAPLAGILRGSKAFIGGDGFLYIDSALSLASEMMKQEGNAAKLINAVESCTSVRYKLRMKTAPIKKTTADKLTSLLQRARENGVEIKEEE